MEERDGEGRRRLPGAASLAVVFGLALSSVGCAHGAQPKAPMGHLTVTHPDNPEDAPEEAKTVQVEYAFDRDVVNKDFDKTFEDGFEKKGVKVDEKLRTHAHFDVKDAKITGTVTYVKKGLGHYSIVEADLVATGHYDADVQVDLDVAVKGDSKKAAGEWDKTLIGGKPVPIVKNMMPTNIPIAGPLFLHAHFDLSAACEVQVEGQMHATTGVGVSGDVHLAAKYKKAGFSEDGSGKKKKFEFQAKAPNFELAPKPYLQVQAKNQQLRGRCSLQPTAVLLIEHSVGAKLAVEPYVELDARRATTRDKWKIDAQAGVSVHAATDIEVFGRHIGHPKEHKLFDIALTKPTEESTPEPARPSAPAHVEVAALLDGALADPPKPVAHKGNLMGVLRKKKR